VTIGTVVREATLTEHERSLLPDAEFAVPEKRVLPIHDESHARLAWDMLDRTGGLEDGERRDARHRIARALHRFGVKLGHGVEEEAHRQLNVGGFSSTGAAAGQVADRALEAVVVDETHRLVEVTIARPGVSENGYVYSDSVLREATPLWNGAPAFLDHPTALDLTRAGSRSLRDLVGVYEGARYEVGRGIRARLRLSENDHGVFQTIREALSASSAGHPAPPIGISADWKLLRSPSKAGGKARFDVHAVVSVNSGDLVIRPSAGGSFDRILEAQQAERPAEVDYTGWGLEDEGVGVGFRVSRQDGGVSGVGFRVVGDARGGNGVTGQLGVSAVVGDVREGQNAQIQGSTVVQPSAGSRDSLTLTLSQGERRPDGARGVGNGLDAGFQSAVQRAVEAAMAPMRQQMAAAQLESRLAASGLPSAAQAHVRQQFAGRVFEASEVDGAIAGLRGLLGDVFGQRAIRGVGASILDPGYVQGTTALDKVQAAFDRLFGLDVPSHLTGIPRLTGIREAYVLITGDKFFTGNYHWEESIVREANEVTTSVLSNVVLNSMTKRIVRDYQAQPKWWEPFTIKVPILDMKQQNRIRLNDFASLSTVNEDASYTNAAWGDARENYTPSKFGNLVVVTLESVTCNCR
jgi:hypothetical protein